jgi:hypothetical protein
MVNNDDVVWSWFPVSARQRLPRFPVRAFSKLTSRARTPRTIKGIGLAGSGVICGGPAIFAVTVHGREKL